MDIIVLTPVRLFADALSACFHGHAEITVKGIARDLEDLRQRLRITRVDLALIDVTPGVDLDQVRSLASEYPDVALVAVGLIEQRQQVINCGRAGFAGYVPRDASVELLCRVLADVTAGRLECPPDISGGLLRALFRVDDAVISRDLERALTSRESEVLQRIGRGLSNKEIARELVLSVATVKHHVHNILEKLRLSRRAEAMRRVRDAPWLVACPAMPLGRRRAADKKVSGS
jgi:two-component system nitrate/nitrite response regulator NarL